MRCNMLGIVPIQIFTFASVTGIAHADGDWQSVTEPDEVRSLVSGKTLDGKYWRHFYRDDGNMAYQHLGTNTMSVRKWSIRPDGQVCVAVFVKPERVIDCFTLLRAADDPTEYQLKWASGLSAFEILDTPPEIMANAVNETAGASK